ncbi:hypothetical protein EMIT048CA2_20496 [Pseudomonas chlororaphis]
MRRNAPPTAIVITPATCVQLLLYIKTAQRLGFSLGAIGSGVAP